MPHVKNMIQDDIAKYLMKNNRQSQHQHVKCQLPANRWQAIIEAVNGTPTNESLRTNKIGGATCKF